MFILLAGEWKDDKRHGKGSYTYSQGDVYTGDWADDERHGLGTYTFKQSSAVVVFGTWVTGKMKGKGKILYPNFTFHGRFLHSMVQYLILFLFQLLFISNNNINST